MLAIVALHLSPWSGAPSGSFLSELGHATMFAARWAVPFFFVHAGYFFAARCEEHASRPAWRRSAARLILALLFWDAFYIVAPAVAVAAYSLQPARFWEIAALTVKGPLASPLGVLFPGTAYHLWFLGAMVLAVTLIALVVRKHLNAALAVLVGVNTALAWSPAITRQQLARPLENVALVIAALAAAATGAVLWHRRVIFTPALARRLVGIGIAAFVLEIALRQAAGTTLWWNDQISPTLPLLGLAAFAAWHAFGGFDSPLLRWLAEPLSLGIYGLHVLALGIIDRMIGGPSFWRPPVEVLVVFLACAAITRAMVHVPRLRPFFR